jgi:hypothetical protein
MFNSLCLQGECAASTKAERRMCAEDVIKAATIGRLSVLSENECVLDTEVRLVSQESITTAENNFLEAVDLLEARMVALYDRSHSSAV